VDDQGWRRLKGLKRLIHDGVRQGADFVEKHHRRAAAKPFTVLESIPLIAAPTKVVHGIHDGVLWLSYGGIRTINQALEAADDWLMDQLAPADDDHCPDHDAPPET
jgi:hypothetical protein